ncbi:hypothetical protein CANMA_003586 [Candida margitis]|uniref:uncharacterized protein n=1 Tax=Candida margitis TaxID=1775924 RepID=UPI002226D84C|nr:uncharacterized protein CANMA_003586 [Candida margitis]KAI5963989.1 hypothetical protein CANMA_003586 [Candida margitis]
MLVTFSSRATSNNLNQNDDRSTETMNSSGENTESNTPKSTNSRHQQNESATKIKNEKQTTTMKARQHQSSFQVALKGADSPQVGLLDSQNGTKQTSSLLIKSPTDFHKFKENGRSRLGCLTCKIRKKKCDEIRPVCSDCKRLNKKCHYVDQSTMTTEEIRSLKRKVELEESNHKLRRRKKKKSETASKKENKQESKESNNTNVKLDGRDKQASLDVSSPISGLRSDELSSSKGEPGAHHVSEDFEPTASNPILPIVDRDTHALSLPSPSAYISNMRSTANEKIELQNIETLNNAKPLESEFNLHQASTPSPPVLPPHTDPFEDVLGSFKYPHPADNVSMESPSAFLNLLREMNHTAASEHKIEELDDSRFDELKHLAASSPEVAPDIYAMIESFDQARSSEHVGRSLVTSSPSFPDLVSTLNAHLNPTPNPQPSLLSIPELADPSMSYLYNYYVEVISNKVSVAPTSQNESNSYQRIFLPLAQKDKGVLYSILAWAGFQLGGKWEEDAANFVSKAMSYFHKNNDILPYGAFQSDRNSIINKLAILLILVGANICKGDVKNWSVYLRWGWRLLSSNGGILRFNQSKEENWLISNFAYHDLLASSTSERGTYFTSHEYNRIFEDHDVFFLRGQLNPLLGISKKLFTIIGEISTLLYESKKLLREYYSRGVDNHFEQSREFLNEYLNGLGDENKPVEAVVVEDDEFSNVSDHSKASQLLSIMISKAKDLERQIDESKPDKRDICNLTDSDLELQLTLFEAFQLSAKLFLRQSILRCNPSHLESQMINNDLIKCLDILTGTPVQASLVFPFFISGIHCVSKHDQELMLQRVNSFIKHYGMFNANRAREVMQKIWKENCNGDKIIDWHGMLNELGWDLNFA